MRLNLSPLAQRDLAAIYDYTAEDNIVAAKCVTKRLRDQMKYILRHPQVAPARDHLIKGLRALPVDSYTIYYLPQATEIKIVRVLHAAQDVQDQFV